MNVTWIEAGKLCAGGIPISRVDIQSLYTQGVRAIVTLTEYPLVEFEELTPELFTNLGMTLLHMPVRDRYAPSRAQAEQIAHFIDTMAGQNQPVYLHCHAGIGRTGAMLHSYYLLRGETLAEATARINGVRPESQYSRLTEVQRSFLEELAAALAAE